ncbi:MAG: hypothetical protein FJY66_03610, partial [Calditrichaeota bacterium]|nr:hypothetical protein [Calditrichota bacterium]
MRHSRLSAFLCCVLLACTAACAQEIPRAFGNGSSISHYFPPPRLSPAQTPSFERGEPNSMVRPLDQFDWTLMQLLYDADTTYPYYRDTLNAVPTGMLLYPNEMRAYISTFHTIFFSEDGGFSWVNGDPRPIPNYSWNFRFVRRPNYIYGLAANSAVPNQADKSYIYIVHLNSRTSRSVVRQVVFFYPEQAYVGPESLKVTDYWLGHLVLPDTARMSVLGSWDGYALFSQHIRTHNLDTILWTETYLDPFNWVSGPLAYVNGFLYLAGSHQWVSRDSGRTWEVRPSADEVFDGGVAFVDTLFGWTGGGRISPQSEGWVHR